MTLSFCAVLGYYPKDIPGGAEYQAYLIAKELNKRNYDTHYVAHQSNETSCTVDDGITVHRCSASSSRRSLLRTLSEIDADVYYFRVAPDLPILARAKRRLDATFLYNISRTVQCNSLLSPGPHTDNKGILGQAVDKVRYSTYRFLLRVPDEIFTQTEWQQVLLKRNHGLDSWVIGNGHPVPNEPFQKESPPVVLWLATLKDVKNPRQFIRLAEVTQNVEAKFWMVGRPVDKQLEFYVRQRDSELDNFSYLGSCNVEESNTYFEQASILVHTGGVEGYPNTFIQAWLRKTPVVSLNADPDSVLADHDIGFHCQSFDELSTTIAQLIENSEYRGQLGANARDYAISNHSIEEVVDRIERRLQANTL